MTQVAQKLLSDAMALDADEREELAVKLLGTLRDEEDKADANYEALWDAEIQRRVEESDRGAATHVPWEEVRQMMRDGKRLDEAR